MLSVLLLTAATANAAKSNGKPRIVAQPDGTTLVVKLLGDEHFSWYQTTDGVLLKRVDDAFYIGKVTAAGTVESTGVLAHNLDTRKAEEKQLAKAQNKDMFFSAPLQKDGNDGPHKAIANYPSRNFCPHMGEVRVPVIVVEYQDYPLTYKSLAIWEDYFNGTTRTPYTRDTRFQGYGSVGMFFSDASNGMFTPKFDLYGPYTMSKTHDSYGGTSHNLLKEAVQLADGDIDFSKYDSNGDGNVDMVYVLYAGTGANLSNNDKDVWPFCTFYQTIKTGEGKIINVIGAANELAVKDDTDVGTLRAGVGVTCHEMSHGFGLPDLYWNLNSEKPKDDYGYVDYNNCGPEDWDLMDGGENLYNAMWPCQYTAWERDIMGWLDLETLSEPATITIQPLNKGGKAYKVVNPNYTNEYYVIENYAYDEWNYYVTQQYGHGLMISHLFPSSDGFDMNPNTTYGKPKITILPADGFIFASYSIGETIRYKGEVIKVSDDTGRKDYFKPEAKGDPYPGSQNVTSVASYKNYVGENMVKKFPITNIRVNDDLSITFDFMGGDPAGIREAQTANAPSAIYTLGGVCVGSDINSLPHGIYIQNGCKFVK